MENKKSQQNMQTANFNESVMTQLELNLWRKFREKMETDPILYDVLVEEFKELDRQLKYYNTFVAKPSASVENANGDETIPLTVQEMLAITKGEISGVYGNWKVDQNGNIDYRGEFGYHIPVDRVEEEDWVEHMSSKSWVNIAHFEKALNTARLYAMYRNL